MRSNIYSIRNAAREERKGQELAAGLVSERFAGVSSIVVTMNYSRGSFPAVLRTVNYYPGSPAYFKISCLGDGCDSGALDLTSVIGRMIGARERSAKGKLSCDKKDSTIVHPKVNYEVAISYS